MKNQLVEQQSLITGQSAVMQYGRLS